MLSAPWTTAWKTPTATAYVRTRRISAMTKIIAPWTPAITPSGACTPIRRAWIATPVHWKRAMRTRGYANSSHKQAFNATTVTQTPRTISATIRGRARERPIAARRRPAKPRPHPTARAAVTSRAGRVTTSTRTARRTTTSQARARAWARARLVCHLHLAERARVPCVRRLGGLHRRLRRLLRLAHRLHPAHHALLLGVQLGELRLRGVHGV